jgi:hypothetical protein
MGPGGDAVTEAEWDDCADPQQMLWLLRRKASYRKMRLFFVACCRKILSLLEGVEKVPFRRAGGPATLSG